ncbi:MAG: hypothetical protein ACFFCS_06345 [Candidatus Hodarchaeota archaeon]
MEKIEIEILGSESMGVRSLCTKVTTPDLSILLDPGCALGPRRGHQVPHPDEYAKLHEITGKILEASRSCKYFFISHYHHDHFKPRQLDEMYIHTSHELFKSLFKDKVVYLKSLRNHIGTNQKKRGRYLKQAASKIIGEFHDADYKQVKIGDTMLDFSWPVKHGEAGSNLGHVILLRVRHGKETFVFAPDVQGPVIQDTMKFFLDIPPDVAIVGGPPFYLKDKLKNFPYAKAIEFIKKLHGVIPRLVLDHHCCRSIDDYDELMEKISIGGSHEACDAATYMGQEREYLEAKRDDLYKTNPPGEKFMAWARMDVNERMKINPLLGT